MNANAISVVFFERKAWWMSSVHGNGHRIHRTNKKMATTTAATTCNEDRCNHSKLMYVPIYVNIYADMVSKTLCVRSVCGNSTSILHSARNLNI